VRHPILFIIQGEAAIGKTALARCLAHDLNLPAIGKDDFSEMMYDKIGVEYNAPSASSKNGVFSTVALRTLGLVAEEFMKSGQPIIIEAPFHVDLTQPFLRHLSQTNAQILQIYCYTDQATRQKRYDERLKSGTRHPGHGDRLGHKVSPPSHPPLDVANTIKVDLTFFRDTEYQKLLTKIKQNLASLS
jgi:predicted kinase